MILYGEEATKQAQKEGEEAAAAYEKEKRDIAAGIIPAPTPNKPKKKAPKKDKSEGGGGRGRPKNADGTTKKRKSTTSKGGDEGGTNTNEKKTKTNTKACKLEKEAIGSTVAKGVTKVSCYASPILKSWKLRVVCVIFRHSIPVLVFYFTTRHQYLPLGMYLKVYRIRN